MTSAATARAKEIEALHVYLSGPMSGIADFNFPAFIAAAEVLRAAGYIVLNPAEINTDTGMSWEDCLRNDIRVLCDCAAIVLLPGWERSKGAQLEQHIAHRLGMEILFYADIAATKPARTQAELKQQAQDGSA